jgi:hypothetical protein
LRAAMTASDEASADGGGSGAPGPEGFRAG